MMQADCPIEGILELEEGKLGFMLIKVVVQSHTPRRGAVLREINRLEPSSALNQLNNEHDDGNHEQKMD